MGRDYTEWVKLLSPVEGTPEHDQLARDLGEYFDEQDEAYERAHGRPYDPTRPPDPPKRKRTAKPPPEIEEADRLLISREYAIRKLGDVSMDWFEAHVQGEIKTVRRGGRVLIPVAELARWCAANEDYALKDR